VCDRECADDRVKRGVTVSDRYSEPQDHGPAPPYRRAPRLGPRALSISVVNSFGGGFVW